MSSISDDPNARLRWSVYWLLITLSVGSMTGRILAVNSVDKTGVEKYRIEQRLKQRRAKLEARNVPEEKIRRDLAGLRPRLEKRYAAPRPFLSANDRSRWCTVRALVEHGTYAIDQVTREPNWDTIDMVKHKGRDGRGHLYSSKPTLFPTLMAAEYWVIHKITGATLGTHPFEIGRFMLITINVVPMVVFFVLLARLVERYGTTDWGRMFVIAAAVFGTFLTTFAVVINNHLIGAVSAMVVLYATVRIWYEDERRLRYFIAAGFFAAFTASAELPALSFFALFSAALLWKAPRETLLAYMPAALLVAAGSIGTNYIAHNDWLPAYAHREKGQDWETGNWYNFTYQRGEKETPRKSYWADVENRSKLDQGEPSRAVYAVNVLVGHHGIFSLTPVWLLAVLGVGMLWFRRDRPLRELAAAIAVISLVVIAFYLLRPLQDRNYGGDTCGFRWAFWFAPFWLFAMLPAADWSAGSRIKRCAAAVLLAVSVLSASYPTWNPWTHPWIFRLVTSP